MLSSSLGEYHPFITGSPKALLIPPSSVGFICGLKTTSHGMTSHAAGDDEDELPPPPEPMYEFMGIHLWSASVIEISPLHALSVYSMSISSGRFPTQDDGGGMISPNLLPLPPHSDATVGVSSGNIICIGADPVYLTFFGYMRSCAGFAFPDRGGAST